MSYSRGSSLNGFLVEFDKLISDLKSVGSVIDKKEYITKLLSAMPGEFSAVITSIDIILHTNPEGVSCDFVRNRLLAEEERLKKVESSESDRNFDSGNAFSGIGRRRIVNRNSNSNFGNFRKKWNSLFVTTFVSSSPYSVTRYLLCDNAGENSSSSFKNFCRQKGITIKYTVPRQSLQNGKAEKFNRDIMEKTRCLLYDSGVDRDLWGEALRTAVYLKNRTETRALPKGILPAELWYGYKPNWRKSEVLVVRDIVISPRPIEAESWMRGLVS
ncbi:unnamed protein product [Nesidiocoris tenuis]|uniref:Integrase catalytic domain-containing protein n=1 Tax=Nesidiocoris tenuis TaxID=355587 RepID=A0A6H5HQ49_9HEMI|nr:unnamed protein product [Nesidiocoris tenuis]